jgi:hypothetical protein
VLALLILGGVVVGVGVTLAINAYIKSVEGGLEPPKEFQRLKSREAAETPVPTPEAAPSGATAATGGAPAAPASTGPSG